MKVNFTAFQVTRLGQPRIKDKLISGIIADKKTAIYI